MSNIDVGVRLRLEYQKRNAEQAERDLKDIKKAADQLGRADAGKLDRKLADVRREAGRGEQAIERMGREARQLNTVNTNALDREIKQVGTSSRTAQRDVAALRREVNTLRRVDTSKLQQMDRPAKTLNRTMGMLAASASGAIGGLMAFASVDNIIRGLDQLSRKFQQLDRDVASVAVTAEMRTPEAIAKIGSSNERLSLRYGMGQTEVNAARKTYAAAGFGLEQQENILDPTLKAAKAGDSSGETMATAVISAQQALGVKDSEIPKALDMMSKGSKLGRFEVDDMAKNFPALATMYGGTGRDGLQGWGELVALSQIVNLGAGSPDIAANNLQNIIAKLSSPDTVKNFAEKGVDLEKLKARSAAEGKPYMMAVVDEAMRLSKGNEFVIGELFGDMQAKQALAPLINNRQQYEHFLDLILNSSDGTVNEDWEFLLERSKEQADRRGAALESTGAKYGQAWDRLTAPTADRIVRGLNPEYDRQRTIEEEPALLRETGRQRLELENEMLRLQGQARDMGDGGLSLGPQINRLKAQIQTLMEEEAAIIENARRAAAGDQAAPASDPDLGKSTGAIGVPSARPGPIPSARPIEQQLGKDLSGAADSAMDGYIDRLTAAGDRAVGIAQEKAAEMQRVLNFTATPTIAPNFAPPKATAGPDKHSSIAPTSTNSKVTQYITAPSSKLAAVRARRGQSRAIAQAQARSLYDIGPGLA